MVKVFRGGAGTPEGCRGGPGRIQGEGGSSCVLKGGLDSGRLNREERALQEGGKA